MSLPQHLSTTLQVEDVKSILKICNFTMQNFEYIGNLFVSKFSRKYNVVTMGSALIAALGELGSRTKLRQRLVLLYLIYKANELDVPPGEVQKRLRKEIVESLQFHPFLPFLLFLMGGENNANYGSMNFVYTFTPIVLHAKERYMLGLLLTGRCDEVMRRSPMDFAQMVIHQEEVFDLRWLTATVKLQQNSYSSIGKASTPAFLKVFDEIKNLVSNEDLDVSLVDILTKQQLSDIILPSFYRFVPTLMPPSDDEFQFLYPFLLEPLWMDPEMSKGEVDECVEEACTDNLFDAESSLIDPLASLTVLSTDPSSFSLKEKAGGSLPCSPKASLSTSLDGACSFRAASVCSLPPSLSSSFASDGKSSSAESSPSTDSNATLVTPETSKLSKNDAIQLLNKALKGVIARQDTQRLADAISSDPTITDSVEIFPNYFPKLINDNPAVAAAVIIERTKKNPDELPAFFEILTKMNPCVQGMEVVNKLCSQLAFPQEYLNRFISSCVQRCDDPNLSSASLCRQVRVICVFLSSLMRNKAWSIHPLSVELQSFALKYSHVREASSLYQAIMLVMQSELSEEGGGFTHR